MAILAAMNRIVCIIGMAVASGVVNSTVAAPLSPTAQAQRQLAVCMSRQMAASKTVSYNQASKICKELLKHPSDNLTASDAAKSAGVRSR